MGSLFSRSLRVTCSNNRRIFISLSTDQISIPTPPPPCHLPVFPLGQTSFLQDNVAVDKDEPLTCHFLNCGLPCASAGSFFLNKDYIAILFFVLIHNVCGCVSKVPSITIKLLIGMFCKWNRCIFSMRSLFMVEW